MNRRLSRAVATSLAHPAGFLIANLFGLLWFGATFGISVLLRLPPLPVFLVSLAVYLDVFTHLGMATQFTLAYQNREKEERDDLLLRSQLDTMHLVLAIAERIEDRVDGLADVPART